MPRIYHRKEYEASLVKRPDYRLTCFYVDKAYRRKGVAAAALRGALDHTLRIASAPPTIAVRPLMRVWFVQGDNSLLVADIVDDDDHMVCELDGRGTVRPPLATDGLTAPRSEHDDRTC